MSSILRHLLLLLCSLSAVIGHAYTFPTPNPLDFGNVALGDQKDLVLTGINGTFGSVIAFRIEGDLAGEFSIVDDHYGFVQPTNVRRAVIRFKPKSLGTKLAQIRIRHVRFSDFSFDHTEYVALRGFSKGGLTLDAGIPAKVLPSVRGRLSQEGVYNLNASIVKGTYKVFARTPEGDPLRHIDVKIRLTSSAGDSGHSGPHQGLRPSGWVFSEDEALEDSAGYALDNSAIVPTGHPGGEPSPNYAEAVITTNDEGVASFVYVAPELSGIDRIHAESVDDPAMSGDLEDIQIRHELVDLSAVASFPFRLYGVTNAHPENWFVKTSTIERLQTAASIYKGMQTNDPQLKRLILSLKAFRDGVGNGLYDFPNQEPGGTYQGGIILPETPEVFFINDASLKWGGLFDIAGAWASPHGGHRDGTTVDMKSIHLVPGAPYTVAQGSVVAIPGWQSSTGDPRLLGVQGQSPFGSVPRATRNQMNEIVKRIQNRRLTLLLGALRYAGGRFAKESSHIHVSFN